MKNTYYLTTTVQKGNRLDISFPELAEGQTVEVILIVSENQTQIDCESENISSEAPNIKENIMKKSLTKRRQMLAKQAEEMKEHYEQDKSWQEWVNIDLGKIYEY